MDRDLHESNSIPSALGYLTHGVYVLGSRRGREVTAMAAAWVTQASERPPCVAVAVRDDRYTRDLVAESSIFSLSVLREDQVEVATYFGDTSGEYHEKFQGIPYGQTPGGAPFLLDCMAYLDCRVMDTVRAGDHTVFVGEVTAAEVLYTDSPQLIYDPDEYEGALN